MIELFRSIVDTIKTFVEFLFNSLESLLRIIQAIPNFTVYIFNLINNLIPDILKPFLGVSIFVSLILFVIGRNK